MAAPFKDLVDRAVVDRYAQGLDRVVDADAFRSAVLADLPALELKGRVRRLADGIADHARAPVPAVVEALLGLMGPPADLDVKNSADFGLWPATDYVERHALGHLDLALDALHALTQRFTAEFALRPFLVHHPAPTWARVDRWVTDASPHVRRLCSEGTRPRLPWGAHLTDSIADPSPGLAVLERLRADPHPYVRRSVANHLGDVAKDHLDVAVAVLERWKVEVPGPDTDWIVRHALRLPVKQGAPAALRCIGLDPTLPVAVRILDCSPRVVLGEALTIRAELLAERDGDAEIDLLVHFVKTDGRRSPKPFKGVRRSLRAGVPEVFERRLPLADVSTRRHHAGAHRVEVQVNGEVRAGCEFELVVPE